MTAATAVEMGRAAEVIITGRHGVFIADVCRVEPPMVHLVGRWRTRHGANYQEFRFGERAEYAFPLRRCEEIRWRSELST